MESSRTVLLVHTLPDGSAHIDWMVECPLARAGAPSAAHRLATWRVVARIDRPPHRPFRAVRLPEHRDRYLVYEGPLAGGRGSVRRLASGVLIKGAPGPEAPFTLRIAWSSATIEYRFHPGPDPGVLVVRPRVVGPSE